MVALNVLLTRWDRGRCYAGRCWRICSRSSGMLRVRSAAEVVEVMAASS